VLNARHPDIRVAPELVGSGVAQRRGRWWPRTVPTHDRPELTTMKVQLMDPTKLSSLSNTPVQ